MSIAWNDKARRAIFRRRSTSAWLGPSKPVSDEKRFEDLRAFFLARSAMWIAGFGSSDRAAAARARVVLEAFERGAQTEVLPDEPTAAVAAAMAFAHFDTQEPDPISETFAIWTSTVRGPAFAVRILEMLDALDVSPMFGAGGLWGIATRKLARWATTPTEDGQPVPRLLIRPRGPNERPKAGANAAWRGLRFALGAADEASYRAAVEEARLVRECQPRFRHALAFAFPDETSWASEDARAALSGAALGADSMYFLLAALSDPELALALVRRMPFWSEGLRPLACTLVDALGEAALPVLDGLCTDRVGAPEAKVLGEAMALIVSPDAARILGTKREHKHLRTIANAYFQAHPELSAPSEIAFVRPKS